MGRRGKGAQVASSAGSQPRGRLETAGAALPFVELALGLILLVGVPLSNGLSPGSALHVPNYLVPLLGKYVCFALLALVPISSFREFGSRLDAPIVILPLANHDNNQHAPDENLRIANLWYGVDLWTNLLTTDFSSVTRPA